MLSKKLLNHALNGLDRLGFYLDSMGITNKVTRHNLAARAMLEQKRLEGQWDSLQVRLDRKKLKLENTVNNLERRADTMVQPLLARVSKRFNSKED
ncbi:hypothetical protein [Marinobacter sp. X15-166B]|uniref:hypothetical protein n=1 Tax=Marinobacter sp. X15-166B TaxID=1897620 RepID=UPI00085BFDE1|nr:hypothetical protein [Marinobacter sp. X15-166B]OEY65834.1 hypothetical protein BG841_04785 [Marinobacter sp. X15-166B]